VSEGSSTGGSDIRVSPGRVSTIEIVRPPNNYFDIRLIEDLVAALQALASTGECRAVVLCSQGKHFCAGADISSAGKSATTPGQGGDLYDVALGLFEHPIPIVAAIQGAAIGGGLGLALSADFRVAAPDATFSANFARLGFHHGFGLTVTLPAVVGQQQALDLLYTGRKINGAEATRIGLCDRLAPLSELRDAATDFAAEIASSAPLAIRSIRRTMRGHLVDAVKTALYREREEQFRLMQTLDWSEGVKAAAERRPPIFSGQ
jgi:2-(1,2-epoxy-1,2-dihydrophenyl)acetyl-CoA isomerase